jgi:Patatin-like phospholipase
MQVDYVTQLAAQAFQKITSGSGEEIERIVGSALDPDALAARLASRSDLQAKVAALTGYTPSKWILEHELQHVDERRKKLNIDPVTSTGDSCKRAADSGLMGLCFSGGGIRSATFNLGILQGLAELNLLRCFDYLSTVSGGGYIHQWLAAWSQRRGFIEVEKQLIPLPDPGNPGTHPETISWLRRYSNYLTPENGLLTADTWVAFATWLRNTLLNQTILVAGLLFLVLLPHLLVSRSIAPGYGPAIAAVFGAVFYLFFLATYFVGENLWRFGPTRGSSQPTVQVLVVLPLMTSALLLTLLVPAIATETFGLNLSIGFLGSSFLMFAMALTITLAGGAPLCYLKTHHRTAQYPDIREFLAQKPKCSSHVKFLIALLGMLGACVFAAVGGGAWIAGSIIGVAEMQAIVGRSDASWRLALTIGPPLIVGGFLVTMLIVIGLLGRTFEDARREWLSRLAGWIGLFMLLWVLCFGFSLFGYYAVQWLGKELWAGLPVLAGWLVTFVSGLIAANSPKTSGAKSDKAPGLGLPELLARIGPYAFVAGLLLLISASAEVLLRNATSASSLALVASYLVPAVICLIFAWRVDINEFSLHAFYRNRLTRCYLGASTSPRHANPFTGFDEADANVALSDLLPGKGYDGPFPIFCTALNLTFGEDLAWQERKAASFAFTPLYSGYDVPWTAAKSDDTNLRFNGFVETASYAYPRPGIHVSTAAAISGAAVSPNMGYHTNPATAFLLTVFSVRLGWWLSNPRVLDEDGTKLGSATDYPWPSPRISLMSLGKELLGETNDTSNYVYLSDGGHFDNMGLYELVRRRCPYIVICDSEDDGELKFDGIGMAIRKCRVDFGAEVALDLRPLQHSEEPDYSAAHCVVGTIVYAENPGTPGIVVYIKSSLTGDEPADVLNYKKEHSAFPHDTTLNQWFTESQFESYRRLGHHVASSVLQPAGRNLGDGICCTASGRRSLFESLRSIWWSPTPEMDRFRSSHTTRYEALLVKARTDVNLPGFFDMMFSDQGDWKNGHNDQQIEYAVRFSSEMIEFIWMVFDQLNLVLPEKLNHPYARGWSRIFTKWTKIDVVREGWKRYRMSYSPSFCSFAESDHVGLRRD